MRNPIIEITVTNHPGVMSHITGLVARRAFTLQGLLYGPSGDGGSSRIYLLVNETGRLPQLIKQLEKLHDVSAVCERHDYDHTLFHRLHEFAGAQ